MALQPTDAIVDPTASPLRQRFPFFRAIGGLNDFLYAIEVRLVGAALLIMSALVFLDVLFRFLVAQRGVWMRMQEGEVGWAALWGIPSVLLLCVAILTAGFSASPTLRSSRSLIAGLTVLSLAALVALSVAMLHLPSRWVVTLCALVGGMTTVMVALRRPIPQAEPYGSRGFLVPVGVAVATTLALMHFGWRVPEGYSWSQHVSLFLLLWTAFLGASMATYTRRHLSVDAVRKSIPARHLPLYNALSSVLSALFCALLGYLAWRYLQARLGQSPVPGEIPTWLKAAAIPFSLGLVTARFFGHAVHDALVWGMPSLRNEGAA